MEILYDVLVIVHLLGMAGIVSGLVTKVAAGDGPALAITTYSAGAQVLTGVAMVGIASAGLVAAEVDNTKIAVKLLIALAVLVVAVVLWRRRAAGRGALAVLAALVLANVVIAVVW